MVLVMPRNLGQQITELQQKVDTLLKLLQSFKTESGMALGKILENQNIDKPTSDMIIHLHDDWFDTKYADYGVPK